MDKICESGFWWWESGKFHVTHLWERDILKNSMNPVISKFQQLFEKKFIADMIHVQMAAYAILIIMGNYRTHVEAVYTFLVITLLRGLSYHCMS